MNMQNIFKIVALLMCFQTFAASAGENDEEGVFLGGIEGGNGGDEFELRLNEKLRTWSDFFASLEDQNQKWLPEGFQEQLQGLRISADLVSELGSESREGLVSFMPSVVPAIYWEDHSISYAKSLIAFGRVDPLDPTSHRALGLRLDRRDPSLRRNSNHFQTSRVPLRLNFMRLEPEENGVLPIQVLRSFADAVLGSRDNRDAQISAQFEAMSLYIALRGLGYGRASFYLVSAILDEKYPQLYSSAVLSTYFPFFELESEGDRGKELTVQFLISGLGFYLWRHLPEGEVRSSLLNAIASTSVRLSDSFTSPSESLYCPRGHDTCNFPELRTIVVSSQVQERLVNHFLGTFTPLREVRGRLIENPFTDEEFMPVFQLVIHEYLEIMGVDDANYRESADLLRQLRF